MHMPKRKRVPVMLARGGHSQADVAAIVGCGKRDVSECARFLREGGIGAEGLEAMSEADAASIFAAPPRGRDGSRPQVDAPALTRESPGTPGLRPSSCGPSAARPHPPRGGCRTRTPGSARSSRGRRRGPAPPPTSRASRARGPAWAGRGMSPGSPAGSRAGGPRRAEVEIGRASCRERV